MLRSAYYHPGGIALNGGILHKTVKAVCDHDEVSGSIARIYTDRIELQGIGEEEDFVFAFDNGAVSISGTAPVGSIIMTDTGELTETGLDGNFKLTVPFPGVYSLKAVAEGKEHNAPAGKAAVPFRDLSPQSVDTPYRYFCRLTIFSHRAARHRNNISVPDSKPDKA